MAKSREETIRDVAESLIGTSGFDSLEDVMEEHGVTKLSLDELRTIDEITLECQDCGWWCEASSVNDDGVCEECLDDT